LSAQASDSRENAGGERGDRVLLIVALAPLALLLLLAILRYTMEIVLEPRVGMTWIKIVLLPLWIPTVIVTPAALAGLIVKRLWAPTAAWCVTWLVTVVWGGLYLLPWIVEKWGPFLTWIEVVGIF
jgi:hypothetical protein